MKWLAERHERHVNRQPDKAPDRYAAQRRLVLSAAMLACHGRVQREGAVVHVVADRLEDLSSLLRSVGGRDTLSSPAGKDRHGGNQPREAGGSPAASAGIRVPTRDFR